MQVSFKDLKKRDGLEATTQACKTLELLRDKPFGYEKLLYYALLDNDFCNLLKYVFKYKEDAWIARSHI
jgi:hypothetical protein